MLIVLSLMGCLGANENNFAERYADALCSYDEHCHKTEFVEEWDGDIQDCVDDILDNVDASADCAFDPEMARSCLAGMRDARQDCDDEDRIEGDCYDAFDCPGVIPSKLSAETFYPQLLEVFCNLGCTSPYIQSTCDDAYSYSTGYFDCPEFDIEAAEACLDPDNWSCSTNYGSGGTFPVQPQECNQACNGSYTTYTDYSY